MAWYEIFNFRPLINKVVNRQDGLVGPRDYDREVSLRHEADLEVEEARVRQDHEHGAPGNFFYGTQGGRTLVVPDYQPKFLIPELYSTVQKMKLGDSSIAAALAVLKLPLLRTEVRIIPGTDDTSDPKDKLIAETTQKKLLDPGSVHETWQKQLRHTLLMLEYGFSPSEKVWTQDADGFLRYARIAPRLPSSVTGMMVNGDGSLKAIVQQGYKGNSFKEMRIPAPTYTFLISYDKEGENHWGRSVLRAMYKHWFYKEELYRMDAVRHDRWSIGIPRAKIAKDYTLKTNDRNDLVAMLRRLRGSEQAWLMHPEQVDIDILSPKPGGSPDQGLMNSVYHHDLMIYRAILAHFIATANAEYGNYGSTRTYAEMFFFAEQALANFVEEEYNAQVVKPFCDANFDMTNRPYPRLQFADVQKWDMGILSDALSKFGLAGFITPDDDMESFIRKSYGWPRIPDDQRRDVTGIINPAKSLRKDGTSAVNTGLFGQGSQIGGGRPPESTGGQDQKVDQRPRLAAMAVLDRMVQLQERIFNFVQGGVDGTEEGDGL